MMWTYIDSTNTVVVSDDGRESCLVEVIQDWIDAGNTPNPYIAPTLDYKQKRVKDYPAIQDQLDMMYHDAIDGTSIWLDSITTIKVKYPKP